MDDITKINSIIEKLEKQNQQDYGIAVFDIVSKNTKQGNILLGEVLTENQKSKIFELAKQENIKNIRDKIKVLSDEKKRYETSWVVVKIPVIDLRLRFVSNDIINEKILRRIRCSQAFKGEILRVLYKNEDQLLAQQNDLTLGWINRSEIIVKKKSLLKEWKKGKYAIKNQLIKSKESKEAIVEEAEKYLGTKYLLGGKTENGIDCSGLIQSAYKNVLDIILPKHSWDQKEMGKKVSVEDVKIGDLVFLIKKNNRHKHVGIVEKKKNNINIIHASLDEKKVVKQSMEKVFEKYEFVEARRIVE